MSSYTDVRIDGISYGGSSRGSCDPQRAVFTSADLHRETSASGYVVSHVYVIRVSELRRRLELLGFTVGSVHASLLSLVEKVREWPEAKSEHLPYEELFDFVSGLSAEDLVVLIKKWHSGIVDRDRRELTQAELEKWAKPNVHDHEESVLTLLEGSQPFLWPDEAPVLSPLCVERLLCEATTDECLFEYDMTEVLRAGYFRGSTDPVGLAFDEELAARDSEAFVLGQTVQMEESESIEFKSISGTSVVDSISKQITKYVIGFLNQMGGSIYYGISDGGVVEAVHLMRDDRDELQRKIGAQLAAITPSIPRKEINIRVRPVIGAACVLKDRYVIQVEVCQGAPHQMYFKNDDTWVRFGTETRVLRGHALFTHILAAYHAVRALPARAPTLPHPDESSL
ncbi:RNA-binding domain-containing protein [Stenotrophomonas maltophilia]|uniref:RNA-binding domain-containing protein n=1 Tax=Stenotrophomonas maltophilia TaxID=40324 RepID=UPI003BF8F3C0